MDIYHSYLNELINENHAVFREHEILKWITPYKTLEYETKRDELINSLSDRINFDFKKTKPWINQISKGCKLCGQGEWSCLFITGRCNANCFYCPAPQDNDDLPTAQKLEFENPDIYADFINYFKFKGCSFSGGEPLLVFDRTLHFLKTLRKKCRPDLYIWMYTNGILASKDKFKALAEAGLNEIRFDIGATNYNLKGLKTACGIIKNVTVEIPAVPEELNRLKKIIPQLAEAGVTNLNLHQLRLTQHNVQKLSKHEYTYLHGEQPTILESEFAALEIISFVDETQIPIGVNYCNFQYKNRFQKAGYRSKIASKINSENEIVTENGFLRKIYVPINTTAKYTATNYIENQESYKSVSEEYFLNNHQKYPYAIIEYSGIILHNQKNKHPLFAKLTIANESYPYERGRPCNPIMIKKEEFKDMIALLKGSQESIPEAIGLYSMWKHEKIEFGRRNYF